MTWLGNFPASFTTVPIFFTTHTTTGAPVAPSSAFEAADVQLFKDGSDVERTSQSGWTMTSPFNTVTGLHRLLIDLSDNTDAGFYAAGHVYTAVLVPDETVAAVAVAKVIGQFGIDLLGVKAETASIQADTNDIQTRLPAALVSGRIDASVGAVAAGAITATAIADGAIDAATFAAGAITATVIADGAIDAATFAAGAITATVIADGAIDAATFAAGAITATVIATDAIDADAMADGAITAATFAAGAIDATAIANGAIDAATFAAGAIDATAIANGAIDAATFAAGAIDATAIADGAIDAATFAAGAITATVIADNAIDAAALAADVATEIRALASGTSDSGSTTTMVDAARTEADDDYWTGQLIVFTSGNIAGQARVITDFAAGTDTITFAPATTQAVLAQTYEIWPIGDFLRPTTSGRTVDVDANGGVEVGSFQAGAITAAAIATDAIDADALADGAITAATFAANAITATVVADGTIDAATFAAGAITATVIADAAIDAATFAAGAITATVIATGAIDADALAADAVDEIWDEVVDGSTTARQSLRLHNSAMGGKASGLATTTAVYRDLADSKDRITATVDADGNRTAVTLDVS